MAMAEAGAFVAIGDLPSAASAELVEVLGEARCIALPADVTRRDEVSRMVEGVMAVRGRLDILVNSAGIGARGAAETYDESLWQRVLTINLGGTFNCCQAAGKVMLAASSGSIINIASIGGLVGYPGSVGYQASKGGVIQLTRSLAIEWAPSNVRVNAIAPSQIETPIVRRQWEQEPQLRDFFLSRTPLARLGQPEDVAGPAVFLASDAAAMVTGQILAVDGGYTAQ